MLKPQFSFLIPLYNESEVFEILVERMNTLINKIEGKSEVVFVDDGSTDGTSILLEKLAFENPGYQCLLLSRNFGQQKALSAGLMEVRGDYIMIMDADLQDPPELFFEFYKKIRSGFDVIYGVRKKRKEGFLKRFFYNRFYGLLNRISMLKIENRILERPFIGTSLLAIGRVK